MDDDLNTSVALAAIHDLKREVNTALDSCTLREDDQRDILALIDSASTRS